MRIKLYNVAFHVRYRAQCIRVEIIKCNRVIRRDPLSRLPLHRFASQSSRVNNVRVISTRARATCILIFTDAFHLLFRRAAF